MVNTRRFSYPNRTSTRGSCRKVSRPTPVPNGGLSTRTLRSGKVIGLFLISSLSDPSSEEETEDIMDVNLFDEIDSEAKSSTKPDTVTPVDPKALKTMNPDDLTEVEIPISIGSDSAMLLDWRPEEFASRGDGDPEHNLTPVQSSGKQESAASSPSIRGSRLLNVVHSCINMEPEKRPEIQNIDKVFLGAGSESVPDATQSNSILEKDGGDKLLEESEGIEGLAGTDSVQNDTTILIHEGCPVRDRRRCIQRRKFYPGIIAWGALAFKENHREDVYNLFSDVQSRWKAIQGLATLEGLFGVKEFSQLVARLHQQFQKNQHFEYTSTKALRDAAEDLLESAEKDLVSGDHVVELNQIRHLVESFFEQMNVYMAIDEYPMVHQSKDDTPYKSRGVRAGIDSASDI